jgi:hypothetical protein
MYLSAAPLSARWAFNSTHWSILRYSDVQAECQHNDTGESGGRRGGAVWVQQTTGSMLMFGGYGYGFPDAVGTCTQGRLNDLLIDFVRFVGGAGATAGVNKYGVYGEFRVFHETNWPGGRLQCAGWSDDFGNGYLYGGNGYAASGGTGYLGDLWLWNASIPGFIWIGGPATTEQASISGGFGEASSDYYPACRSDVSVGRTPHSMVTWIFGMVSPSLCLV